MSVILANNIMETDGSAHNMLLQVHSKLPIVLISKPNNYVFNDALLGVKDYVIVDFVEYGHDVELFDTHLFGVNTWDGFTRFFDTDEYRKLDDFIRGNPPKLYLKRELLSKDSSDKVAPIEYPAMYQFPQEVDTKEKFNQRAFQVFNSWGYSSEYRRQLHGDIWKRAKDFGYMVCDNLLWLGGFTRNESNDKKWITANIPHYCRLPMGDIFSVQGNSKVSISHWGAGKKCFRSAEAPLNAVMALPSDNYAWTFPWVHAENCIRFSLENTIEEIVHSIEKEWLYDAYRCGVENAGKYLLPNYISHLQKLINGL